MDFTDIILKRRSIRKFTDQPVADETVKEILEAAMAAPYAGRGTWQFVVINQREILDTVPSIHPYARMILQAPLAILVCSDLSQNVFEPGIDYWIQNCSAASQNILLAATAKGLGNVWLGIYPRKDRVEGLRKLLSIPEHVVPFALIPIGYPNEEKPPAKRYDENLVHYNKW